MKKSYFPFHLLYCHNVLKKDIHTCSTRLITEFTQMTLKAFIMVCGFSMINDCFVISWLSFPVRPELCILPPEKILFFALFCMIMRFSLSHRWQLRDTCTKLNCRHALMLKMATRYIKNELKLMSASFFNHRMVCINDFVLWEIFDVSEGQC